MTSDTAAPPATAAVVGRFSRTDPRFGATRRSGAPGWVLLSTVAGAGEVVQAGVAVEAVPARAVILAPNGHHTYHVSRRCRLWDAWWAHFPAPASWTRLLEPYRRGRHLYVIEATEEACRRVPQMWDHLYADLRGEMLLDQSQRVWTNAAAANRPQRQLALNTIEHIVLTLLHVGRDPAGDGDTDPRVVEALTIIESEPASASVPALAAAVNLSVSRFAHLFTDAVGRAPNQVIIENRLALASHLLESTDLPLVAVSRASGYPNPMYFSRLFRRWFGTSPSQYRALVTHQQHARPEPGQAAVV